MAGCESSSTAAVKTTRAKKRDTACCRLFLYVHWDKYGNSRVLCCDRKVLGQAHLFSYKTPCPYPRVGAAARRPPCRDTKQPREAFHNSPITDHHPEGPTTSGKTRPNMK